MRSFYRAILAMLLAIVAIFVCCCLTTRTPLDRDTDTCSDVATATIGIQLAVVPLYQECAKWCWAASIAMVSNYYEHRVKQCTLATRRLNTAGHDCCRERCSDSCNEGLHPHENAAIIRSLGLFKEQFDELPTEAKIQETLRRGHPVLLHFEEDNNPKAHLALVSGFIPGNCALRVATTYTFVDPNGTPLWTADSTTTKPIVSQQTYQQLRDGPNGNKPWRVGWIILAPTSTIGQ